MHNDCSEICLFEKAAQVEFRGLREDIREIRERLLRLEQTIGRGVLLLIANLAGLLAALIQNYIQ